MSWARHCGHIHWHKQLLPAPVGLLHLSRTGPARVSCSLKAWRCMAAEHGVCDAPVQWQQLQRRRTCCCGGAAAAAPAGASRAPPPPRRPEWSSLRSGTPAPAALPAERHVSWSKMATIRTGRFNSSAATVQVHVEAPVFIQDGFCSTAGNTGKACQLLETNTCHYFICMLRLLLQAALCGAGQLACGLPMQGSSPDFQWLRHTP